MLALLAFGLWPWIGFAILCVLVIIGLENDSGAGTFFALLGGLVGVYLLSNGLSIPSISGILRWFDTHLLDLILFIVGYVFLGALWGLIKFKFWTHNMADVWRTDDSYYRTQWNNVSDSTKKTFNGSYKAWLQDKWATFTGVKTNATRITMWMAYWPWSAMWTLLNDPLKHAWRFIIRTLGTTYARMAAATFASRFADIKD